LLSHFCLCLPRYASLYFCCAIEDQDNELLTLEVVHRYVELLDRYFGNVCELDIIFNFEKAYFILDEFIIGGEVQETSKRSAVKAIEDSDMLQEVSWECQKQLNVMDLLHIFLGSKGCIVILKETARW
uniref:AP complex mu/sigma subunit domain-containing protein n=1 Tax=Aquila chrysaetos chrysaetos TaxID=223781 RepID=A0A663EEQ6_AQUCH